MQKIVTYIANDGKEFELEGDCIAYEKSLTNKCPVCKGAKGEYVDDGHDCWGNYETKFVSCQYCKGTGQKDAKWEERKRLIDELSAIQQELIML